MPELLSPTGPVRIGQQYYSWYVVRWPGFPTLWGSNPNQHLTPWLINAVKAGSKTIRVDSAVFISPDDAARADAQGNVFPFKIPSEFKEGRGKPWVLLVVWKKVAEGVGEGPSESGVDAITKLIIVLGLAVIGILTVRSFTYATGGVAGALKDTIFNPGFLIAGMVIVALIWGRR